MRGTLLVLALLGGASPLPGQSVLERSPNVHGVWTLDPGAAAFVFAHRFEFINGADEMFNIPTLTLALGLPLGLTVGLDYTSNSEIVPARLGGNETQYFVKRGVSLGADTRMAGMVAYNTAAGSVDGALNLRQDWGRLSLFGELRGFSDLFGRGEAEAAGAAGAALRITPYLSLTGDLGRVLTDDSIPSVWSAAAAIAIPGTPHTFSLQAGNGGALTLQGASRKKTRDFNEVRYGFVFTVPLGTGSQWARVFRPAPAPEAAPPAPDADRVAARVEMRGVAFSPREVRIRAGESVEWVNRDPVVHTATANDGGWGSEMLQEGGRYIHRFDAPGRYPYHCLPHPMMTGIVIVEGA